MFNRRMGRSRVAGVVIASCFVLGLPGAGSALAADYQDAKHNVCEGNRVLTEGCPEWGKHVTGEGDVALGDGMMSSLTTGNGNVALDFGALAKDTSGNNNVAIGSEALKENTTGSFNFASGQEALVSNTTGNSNVAIGLFALFANTAGGGNLAIGGDAGKNVTGSNNIDIENEGVSGDAGTVRIGKKGSQIRAFLAGVYKTPISTPACGVQVNSEGQLGCNSEGDSGAVATFVATKEVASGACLDYSGMAKTGSGACAPTTAGFSTSVRLAPMPANGGIIADLNADSSANVSGTDSVLVSVVDNTTGATLLACTVTASSPHSCSNSAETGSAGAGDNVEVKITASGESGNKKAWRVTFRF